MRIGFTRRAILAVATIGLFSTLFPSFALADATSDARKAIQSAYDAWNAAAQRKDIPGIKALHTADYQLIGRDGKKRTLKDLEAEVKTAFAQIERVEGVTTIDSFRLEGDTATVEYMDRTKLTRHKPDGTTSILKIEEAGRDFWVKKGGKWLRKRTRILDQTADADGRRILQ